VGEFVYYGCKSNEGYEYDEKIESEETENGLSV